MSAHDHSTSADALDVFGFWLYIMSDCVLFAAIFATYAVLHNSTFGLPGIKELTSLPYVFVETMALLASSFTYGMSILSAYKNNKSGIIFWLIITFILGASFVTMEVHEFINMIAENHGPSASAALSAFFTLVGTHGFHVSMGLLWMLVTIVQLLKYGITPIMKKRLTYLGLFWAFLDIVWIFVFTVVYLMGAL